MKVLLDTHALLWIVAGDLRLSAKARRTYQNAESLYFSGASLWEIGIKLGLGRKDFSLSDNWWKEIPVEMTQQGAVRLDVTAEHCREVARLPLHHRDPFDRMLVAQALLEGCHLLSIDPQLDHYAVERVW